MKDRRMILRTYRLEIESCCRQLCKEECFCRDELIASIRRCVMARNKLNRS